MSNWNIVIDYFNSKVSRKLFTRAEVMAHFKSNKKWCNSVQTYMNTLKRAGYIDYEEPGVYRKLKKIPNISEYKMKKDILK